MHSGPDPSSGSPNGKRVFYPYTECEEFLNNGGMWKVITGPVLRDKMAEAAARLMRDTGKFRAAMIRATKEWPKSCETNLTAEGNNQRAWMGHAGCFLATGSSEECTRLGWHRLNPAQQRAANLVADQAISAWRKTYKPLVTNVDQMDLFGSDDA